MGTVFNIQKYSIHDGPGVRTTVFLKGCPLRCLWCHNPEGLAARPELIYREYKCMGCGMCVKTCPNGALSINEGLVTVDDSLCKRCGSCSEVCPTGAMELAGTEMSADEVVKKISRDVLFYERSGGGVTFSGGEPLMQPDFLLELLKKCKEEDMNTVLDTTGYAAPEVIRKVIPYVDLFLYDLKAADTERHRRLTGVDNTVIISNLREIAAAGGKVVIRMPIIPGLNDDEENILACCDIIGSLGTDPIVNLLPYHNISGEKYRRVHREYTIPDIEAPTDEHMEELRKLMTSRGIDARVGSDFSEKETAVK